MMSRNFEKLVILSLSIINSKCQDNTVEKFMPILPLEIPTGKCSEMEKNLTLKLSSAESKKLIDGFMDSSSINCLTLEANQISEISPGSFKFLPNLFYLNLARNSIPTSNLLSFDSHLKLKTLILDENLPNKKGFTLTIKSHFPNLHYLYLRKNAIGNLSTEIGQKLANLTHLYLTDNLIEEMDSFPPNLTHLYLERNRIKKFNLTRVKSMEFLHLDGNKIKIICNTYCHELFSLSLNGASNLRHLSLSENDLNNMEPDSFDDTVNLQSLNLAENKIELIRKGSFHSLGNLENLSMSRNLLKDLPDFSGLTNLRRLNLSENKIEIIPAGEFKNLIFLKTLSLRCNSLEIVGIESFGNLMSLEMLDLSRNKLQYLPINWLTGVENLRTLDLRGNCFADFSNLSLGYMESLKVIFLQNNPMRYVNTRSMSNFPRNVSIFLENQYRVECFGSKSKEINAENSEFIDKGKIPSVQKI